MDHPLLIATACVFGLWLLVGLVLSVRQSLRAAATDGSSRLGAGLVGVLRAVPPEMVLTGLALLMVAAWRAV